MKFIQFVFFIITPFLLKSQEDIHWLINQDSKTDCSFIKSGKFVNEEAGGEITKGYSIEFRGDSVFEKVSDGKYYLKSKIKFTSECSYEITVLKTTIPGYEDVIGKIFFTEILNTSKIDKLIKIRSKGDEWKVLVLRKIED